MQADPKHTMKDCMMKVIWCNYVEENDTSKTCAKLFLDGHL